MTKEGSMKTPKLKPCPFCGGVATPVLGTRAGLFIYYVRCLKCGSTAKLCFVESGAIAAWNRRTP